MSSGGLHTSPSRPWLIYESSESIYFPGRHNFQALGASLHTPQPRNLSPYQFLSLRGDFPLSLLMLKISQHSCSLRTEYNFNAMIISSKALQPLTNVLSSSCNVLSLLLRQREPGKGDCWRQALRRAALQKQGWDTGPHRPLPAGFAAPWPLSYT